MSKQQKQSKKSKQPKQEERHLDRMPLTPGKCHAGKSHAGKFDGGEVTTHRLPGEMFRSAADLACWVDMEHPAPSYRDGFQQWKDSMEDTISEMLDLDDVELSIQEDVSFRIGKEVAFRALEKFVARANAVDWVFQTPEVRRDLAEQALLRPQIPQRTPAWYAQGKEVLTASEFSKLFGTPRCVSQLVMGKVPTPTTQSTNRLACMTCEMGPFDWGVRFEPVVKQILEKKWKVKIAEAGRILHPTDTHVAASPDGIFLEAEDPARVGRLVEIKCPITRKVGEGIPFEYWCQMQVQMEVTGIGECDYVEVKLDSIQGSATDLSGVVEGYMWLLQNPNTCEMKYAYTEEEVKALEGWDLTETIPWRVNKLYTETVVRDKGWYQGTSEMRKQFWESVEKARKGAYQVVEGKPKVIVIKEAPVCLITE